MQKSSASRYRRSTFLCAALGLVAVLSGCTGSTSKPRSPLDLVFNAQSQSALVVLSIASTEDTGNTGIPFLWPRRWSAVWAWIDPETGNIREDGPFVGGSRGECLQRTNQPIGCQENHKEKQYFVRRVIPGTYILARITEPQGLTTEITADSFLFGKTAERNIVEGRVPWFHADPGEIVYIGDYTFDISGAPARLVGIERNDEDAAAALALFPNVSGTMIFRGPANLWQEEASIPPLLDRGNLSND